MLLAPGDGELTVLGIVGDLALGDCLLSDVCLLIFGIRGREDKFFPLQEIEGWTFPLYLLFEQSPQVLFS